ncbi:hypothetical protein O3P69_016280 [Scylla paramamosain]|uniref:Uncharacterized protein n=1 Tax=Scylla paramamosain TaxID=85552 RepID=A0AAW0SEU9_SCYPA
MKSVARPPCAEKTSRADCTEETRTPDRTPIWASPSARASENDGDPLVTEATAAPATHGGTSATRRRRARRKALASWTKSEARLVAPPTMGEAEGCGTVTSVPEDVADALAELKKLLYPDTE